MQAELVVNIILHLFYHILVRIVHINEFHHHFEFDNIGYMSVDSRRHNYSLKSCLREKNKQQVHVEVKMEVVMEAVMAVMVEVVEVGKMVVCSEMGKVYLVVHGRCQY